MKSPNETMEFEKVWSFPDDLKGDSESFEKGRMFGYFFGQLAHNRRYFYCVVPIGCEKAFIELASFHHRDAQIAELLNPTQTSIPARMMRVSGSGDMP